MTSASASGFVLDPSYRRPAGGRTVVGGSPLRLFTVSAAVPVVEALEHDRPLPPGHQRLTDRFVDAGVLHPSPATGTVDPHDVTVVVPCLDEAPSAMLTQLRTIVVDDGSVTPLTAPHGAELMNCRSTAGLAGRAMPVSHSSPSPYVAFVDADVDIEPEALLRLAMRLPRPPGGRRGTTHMR